MFKKMTGVLFELNDTEKEVMAQILDLAQVHVADAQPLRWGSGKQMSVEVSQRLVLNFCLDLRKSLSLPDAPPISQDREELRLAAAIRRHDHHVSRRRVLCAYDHCSQTYNSQGNKADDHPWPNALKAGWKVFYLNPDGPLNTDLSCPGDHDQHGCWIQDKDPQCCIYWGSEYYDTVMVDGKPCKKSWES